MDTARLRDVITDVVGQALADAPTVPGICIAVHQPDEGVTAVAQGVADPATGASLTPEHAVRIASCTKPFVAGTVLELAGNGAFGLDQTVIDLLPPAGAELFARFEHAHVTTVRQLLQHRSGLVDHSTFPEFDGPADTQWTPLTQIAIAVSKPALFAPDTAFSYSDTGYVLLGQVIERITGQSLAAAVRSTLHLDLAEYPSIHWEVMEPSPLGLTRAHQLHFFDDTHDWNPSLDLYGGGGIVATMPDLARWWTALFAGRVHHHLDQQLADLRPTAGPDGVAWPNNEQVALGIFRRTVEGVDVWSHGGYWGLQTLHVPALRMSASLVILHRETEVAGPGALADDLLRALLAS